MQWANAVAVDRGEATPRVASRECAPAPSHLAPWPWPAGGDRGQPHASPSNPPPAPPFPRGTTPYSRSATLRPNPRRLTTGAARAQAATRSCARRACTPTSCSGCVPSSLLDSHLGGGVRRLSPRASALRSRAPSPYTANSDGAASSRRSGSAGAQAPCWRAGLSLALHRAGYYPNPI